MIAMVAVEARNMALLKLPPMRIFVAIVALIGLAWRHRIPVDIGNFRRMAFSALHFCVGAIESKTKPSMIRRLDTPLAFQPRRIGPEVAGRAIGF